MDCDEKEEHDAPWKTFCFFCVQIEDSSERLPCYRGVGSDLRFVLSHLLQT